MNTAAISTLALLLCSTLAHSDIYQHTDEAGRTTYSDSPRDGGKAVELPAINTTPAVTPAEPAASKPAAPSARDALNALRIQQPRDGQIFPNGRIPTQLSVSLQRPLRGGEKVRFSLNGSPISEGKALSTRITLLPRGRHQISASVIDRRGKVLGRDSVAIVVHWPQR